MATAPNTSTTCHGSILAVETRNWASAGFSSTKSSVPCRTWSTTAVRLGLTAPSRTACSRVNQPTTTSDSGNDQPATVRRTPKTTMTGTRVTDIQRIAMRPRTTKSVRYCMAVRAEIASCTRKRAA
jgi:hypothetical protein